MTTYPIDNIYRVLNAQSLVDNVLEGWGHSFAQKETARSQITWEVTAPSPRMLEVLDGYKDSLGIQHAPANDGVHVIWVEW